MTHAKDSLFGQAVSLLQLGAPASYLLLLLSLLALTLIIVKTWEFWDLGITDRSYVSRALMLFHRGQPDEALSLLQAQRGPLAQTLAAAVVAGSQPELSPEQAQEYARVYASERLEEARGLLRPLEVIGQLAPLTGLLGTVLGMISAFQALQLAGERVSPAQLSGGIWEALLTTAAGLVVAIPCIAALNAFERLIERLHTDLESALTRLFTPPVHLPGVSEPTALETLFEKVH
ncbi:MotA/TolQ/ExbB proton channel family protein [Stagnimonas aquatica]|uniref:MotA/TolQ/ExbB proton channel family protein n=1 Tax=Stagnimonas aquatica TaxID=2689987 RepID=A0A3N0VK90_9GAMM|nr:MotA/TolQ/ExbB proton channel family protein [Stagnimonas aquatica]ROH93186.1 MotA/TolQ/ExbB proton channel family protein [Stagnimonas aquatica]